jgi:integral membrane protein (TIGR01906 family)
MLSKINRVLLVIMSIAMMIVIMLSVIDLVALNKSFFAYQEQRLKSAEVIGVSEDDLVAARNCLLDYLKQPIKLECLVNINGEVVNFYNQREIDHMVDVKNLYSNVMIVRNLLGLLAIGLAVGLVRYRQRWWSAFKQAGLIVGGGLALLGLYALIDFQGFWIRFHLIFFTNDLWILDPSTDRLIQMVPQEFFNSMVMTIFGAIVLGLGLFGLMVYSLRAKHD